RQRAQQPNQLFHVTLALSRPSSGRHRTGLQNPERVKFAINELVSALGQKQTFALHLSMDMCSALCMSALGQKRTHAPQQTIYTDRRNQAHRRSDRQRWLGKYDVHTLQRVETEIKSDVMAGVKRSALLQRPPFLQCWRG